MLALRTTLALATLLSLACGPVPGGNVALRGLPERRDAPVDLQSDTDFDDAFDHYYALPLADPIRHETRRAIWKATDTRIQHFVRLGKDTEALGLMMRGLSLWHWSELGDATQSPPDLTLVVPVAERLHAIFARGGETTPAMATLAVLIAAQPQKRKLHDARFAEMALFLAQMSSTDDAAWDRNSRNIGVLEEIVSQFPSEFVSKKLTALYVQRQTDLHQTIKRGGNTEGLGSTSGRRRSRRLVSFSATQAAANILRVHMLAGRLGDAVPALQKIKGQQYVDDNALKTLEKFLAAKTVEEISPAWEQLRAYAFRSRSPELLQRSVFAALSLGQAGLARFPLAGKSVVVQARLAAQLRRYELSTRWAEVAFKLDPKDDERVVLLAQLYLQHMRNDIIAERPDAAATKLAELEKFYASLAKLPDDAPPIAQAHVSLASAYSAVGDMPAAERSLERALVDAPHAGALEQLGVYATKRGNHVRALEKLKASAAVERSTPQEKQIDAVRLGSLIGRAHSGAGAKKAARLAWTNALRESDLILQSFPRPRDMNERDHAVAGLIFGERARLYYFLDRIDRSMDEFELSVDFNEDDPFVYANAIAFMLTRGHYDRALDAYHRALGRTSVTEYYKVYSTLWIVMYARAMGIDPDAFALRYLSEREGTLWLHELARWATHKITSADLLKKANTRGKRAEAYFYEALASYGNGDESDAKQYLQNVIDTDMLTFFEYDMARYFLVNGPPKKH